MLHSQNDDKWRHDDKQLEIMFFRMVDAWKTYIPRQPKNIIHKVHALYKQSTIGDAPMNKSFITDNDKDQWMEWDKLRGTRSIISKRRYIHFLFSIVDEKHIDLYKYHTKPPINFCYNNKFQKNICIWCNTQFGCSRSLLNEFGKPLEMEIKEKPFLLQYHPFQEWYTNHESNNEIGCNFGIHIPITKVQAKPYEKWFQRPDVGGFTAFDSSKKMSYTFDRIMQQQFELLRILQIQYNEEKEKLTNTHDKKYIQQTHEQFCSQIDLIESLQLFYKEKNGKQYLYQIPCQRTCSHCHIRRIADGGLNHFHPLTYERPDMDFSKYDEAVRLKNEILFIGGSPATGLVQDQDERCAILRKKLKIRYEKLIVASRSTDRLLNRRNAHTYEMNRIKEYVQHKSMNQLENALKLKQCETIVTLVKRTNHININYEIGNGFTPLICCSLFGNKKQIIQLIHLGAEINYCNQFGMTALMWAIKKNNLVSVHTLLDQCSNSFTFCSSEINAIYIAIRCNRFHALQIIIEKYNEIMNLNMHEIIEKMDQNALNTFAIGLTPLMICAKHRNRKMARYFIQLGSQMNKTDSNGQTAADIAYHCGWYALSSWLRKLENVRIESYAYVSDSEKMEEALTMKTIENAMAENNLKKIVEVLKHGFICPDYETMNGDTPLILAAKARDPIHVQQLLNQGCDSCYSNSSGITALIAASKYSKSNDALDTIKVLLLHDGIQCFKARDMNGESALSIVSCEKGNEKVMHYLLSYSAQFEKMMMDMSKYKLISSHNKSKSKAETETEQLI